jgi:NAD(P)-dependent dehydrogenase (short-subunit alcohol dehydrogenase family)
VRDVLAVTGAGATGRAIAARLGPGSTVVLGDVSPAALAAATDELTARGVDVVALPLDVTDAVSVALFAAEAAALGPVRRLAHAAGVPPRGSVDRVLAVGLIGTLRVLEAFRLVVAPGGAGLVVTDAAGHTRPDRMPADHVEALGVMSADDLAEVSWAGARAFADPWHAHAFAMRGGLIRVRALAPLWRARGTRLNSVSPGVVAPDDVAHAAEFLLDPDTAYVTGADLLLDGNVLAPAGSERG